MKEQTQPILSVRNVSKLFGGIMALTNLSFDLHKGEILGVIGPNGAGKTTLINCITGFLTPNSGQVFFKGNDISGERPDRIVNMGIGRTFQVVRPYQSLPAYKNLIVPLLSPRAKKFAGGGKLGDRDAVAMDILEDVGFERDAVVPYKAAGSLPLGYLKRLELGRCLALRSEIMLCDEVFSGLSSAEISSMIPLLQRLNEDGTTLLMIEHRLKELFTFASRVVVINFGQKIYDGNSAEAFEDERVRESYLGRGRKNGS